MLGARVVRAGVILASLQSRSVLISLLHPKP